MDNFVCDVEFGAVDMPAVKMLKKLADLANKTIYIVGGFVRNVFANFPIDGCDIDICGDFDGQILADFGAKIVPINKKLGTFKVDFGGFSYEFTRFRAESYNFGGEHTPKNVDFVSDIYIDALRRDFCVNSVYFCINSGKIVDPLGGVDDIKNRVIRAYLPQKVFESDGLRLLRLCRFSAQLGYKIDRKTLFVAKKFRDNLSFIAPERKRDELDKILVADLKYGVKNAHYQGLNLIEKLNLWEFLIPQVEQMRGFSQNPKWHRFDVLGHSFRTVKYIAPHLRLVALLHDIAKPFCMIRDGNMHQHAPVGAEMARQIMGDLRYSKAEIDYTCKLIALHMFDLKQAVGENKMRLFCAENFKYLDDLQLLVLADGKATGFKRLTKPRFSAFKRIISRDGTPISVSDLKIDGNDCVRAGLVGLEIGQVLHSLWHDCVCNPKLNNREWLLGRIDAIALGGKGH